MIKTTPTYDAVSAEQLEVFVACARARSFSAAARRLNRTQSMISHSMARLESLIGVRLFDREGKLPVLTPQGRALLRDADRVSRSIETFKARARSLAQGADAELIMAISPLLPPAWLTQGIAASSAWSAEMDVRIVAAESEAIIQGVLEGEFHIGVAAVVSDVPAGLEVSYLPRIPLVSVVSEKHSLASLMGTIPADTTRQHVEAFCSLLHDRIDLVDDEPSVTRSLEMTNLEMMRTVLLSGLAWGRMPLPTVVNDMAQGHLVAIDVEGEGRARDVGLCSLHRRDIQPGVAGRHFLAALHAAR